MSRVRPLSPDQEELLARIDSAPPGSGVTLYRNTPALRGLLQRGLIELVPGTDCRYRRSLPLPPSSSSPFRYKAASDSAVTVARVSVAWVDLDQVMTYDSSGSAEDGRVYHTGEDELTIKFRCGDYVTFSISAMREMMDALSKERIVPEEEIPSRD